MRRFIATIAMVFAAFALLACDQGPDTSSAFADKTLTTSDSAQEWRTTVTGDGDILIVNIDIDWVTVADVMGIDPERNWHTWQKDHEQKVVQAAKLAIPWGEVPIRPQAFTTAEITLTEVDTGVLWGSEFVVVESDEPASVTVEIDVPLGYHGDLAIGVEWADADLHDGELVVTPDMEVDP